LKSGKCGACPAGYVQDPADKTNCVHGKQVREIKCKRGYRVDVLKLTDYAGEEKLSQDGFAGGSWQAKEGLVKLNADEYLKKVVGHHVTQGRHQGQLARIVYFTNKDRMITCMNKRVKYATDKQVWEAPAG